MPDDAFDEQAHLVVGDLLATGGLELTTAASRNDVEAIVAHLLTRGANGSELAARLVDCRGVAELNADDDAIEAAILRSGARQGPAEPPLPAETEALPVRVPLAAAVGDRDEHAPSATTPSTEIRPLDAFTADARAALRAAQVRADAAGHAEVTSIHLLVELLRYEPILKLANARAGQPMVARARCEELLAKQAKVEDDSYLSPPMIALLGTAEANAIGAVELSDLALAGVKSADGRTRQLFELAMGARVPVGVTPVSADALPRDDADDGGEWFDEEDRIDPREPRKPDVLVESAAPVDDARHVGNLSISADFDRVLGMCAAYRARARNAAADLRFFATSHAPQLPLDAVVAAERALGTALPDDFWVAAACCAYVFAGRGIAVVGPGGEPAPPEGVADAVLAAASGAAREGLGPAGADLIAIADRPTRDGLGHALYVRRGVPYADRNHRPVIVVASDGSVLERPFALVMKDELELLYGPIVPLRSPLESAPRLVGAGEVAAAIERVRHPKFGLGVVRGEHDGPDGRKLTIDFEDGVTRKLLERYVNRQAGREPS